jgi:hypothetical protein
MAVSRNAASANSGAKGRVWMRMMLSSSKPEGLVIFSRSARITFTQLVTIANVIAISRMISTTRVRLCFMARRMGPMFIASP